jgi:tRNA(adenine34) deaminase
MNIAFPENQYMALALKAAGQSASSGDVPVGAVVVHGSHVIGTGWNRREAESRVTAHAEIIALEEACWVLGSWKLNDCDLYVTLEPCCMCASAIMQARIRSVYFGAWDPKAGAAGSVMDLFREPWVNHQVMVYEGIMADRCHALLTEFFRNLRGK